MNTALPRSISSVCLIACLVVSLVDASSGTILGQQKTTSAEPKRLAVDVVSVRGVGRIHGIVLDRNEDSLSIVVHRKWLQQTLPDFWTTHVEAETKAMAEGRDVLKRRIEQWRTEHDGDDGLAIAEFLDDNVKMLEFDKAIDASLYSFTIVSVEKKKLGRVFVQSEERHQLAGIGWSEDIDGLESMTATVLKRKIKDKNIDIDNYALKLGNEMPPIFDSDEKWEARKALIEFAILPRLEYQGTGGVYLRRGKDVNSLQALQGMLQDGRGFSSLQQLGEDLDLPEFRDRRSPTQKNAWLARMIRTAERENRRCFSVSSLGQGETVVVTTTLYFKSLDDQWYPMKEFAASESLRDQKADEIEQIMQDPQISRAVEMVRQLGMSNQGTLEQAMRTGVATKKALARAMSELDSFVERYSFEIDNPPIE